MTDQSTPIPPWAFPGNKVVCVDDGPRKYLGSRYGYDKWKPDGLTKGAVYTIRDHYIRYDGGLCICLEEIHRTGADINSDRPHDPGYGIERFRPLAATDNEIEAQIYNRNSPRKALARKLTSA